MTHKSKAKKRRKREAYAVMANYSEKDLKVFAKNDFGAIHGTYAAAMEEAESWRRNGWWAPPVIYRWRQGRAGGRGRWVRVGDTALECPT